MTSVTRRLLLALGFFATLLGAAMMELFAIAATGEQLGHYCCSDGRRTSYTDFSIFEIGSPLLAFAQTVPPFLAAMAVRRFGFLMGALVGGAYGVIAVPWAFGDLYASSEPLNLVLLAPAVEDLTAALARAIIGAFAGAAGQLFGEKVRKYLNTRQVARA